MVGLPLGSLVLWFFGSCLLASTVALNVLESFHRMQNGFLCSLTQYHSATAAAAGRSFFAAVQRPACELQRATHHAPPHLVLARLVLSNSCVYVCARVGSGRLLRWRRWRRRRRRRRGECFLSPAASPQSLTPCRCCRRHRHQRLVLGSLNLSNSCVYVCT